MTPLTIDKNVALIDKVDGSNASIHEEGVFTWREAEFKRLGYSAHESESLAATRIDIHEIARLIRAGATHAQAWQILVGTCHGGIVDPDWDERHGYNVRLPDLNENDDDGA